MVASASGAPTIPNVIQVRLTVSDLARTRFAYSPLAEVGESLYLLSSGSMYGLQRGWYADVAPRLGAVDMDLLLSVVPPRPWIADFLFIGAEDASTSIDSQLDWLRAIPADAFAAELGSVWRGGSPPPRIAELIEAGIGGPHILAEVLSEYWSVAIEPHWPALRAVLEEDVAYRAAELTRYGVAAMLADMHPELSIHEDVLRIAKKRIDLHQDEHLAGEGLLLVPSVFVWPNVVFAVDQVRPPSLTYPARGVGNLWGRQEPEIADSDPLARAARPQQGGDPGGPQPALLHDRPGREALAEPVRGQSAPVGAQAQRAGQVVASRPAGALPTYRPGDEHRRDAAHPGGQRPG